MNKQDMDILNILHSEKYKNQRAEITRTEKPISNIKSRVEGHAQSGMPS